MKKLLSLVLVFAMVAIFVVMPVSAQLDNQYIDTSFSTAIGGTDFGNIVNGSNGSFQTYNADGTKLGAAKTANASADYIDVWRNGTAETTFRTYTNSTAIFGAAPKNQYARVSFKHKMGSTNTSYVDYRFNWGGKTADWIRVNADGTVKDYIKDKRATTIATMSTTDYNQFDYVINMSDGQAYCYLDGVLISDKMKASTNSQITSDATAWAKGFYHFYISVGTKNHHFFMRDLSHTLYTTDVTLAMIQADITGVPIVDVTGVTVSPTVINDAEIADTFNLTATVAPADATNQSVTWSTNNEYIATVNDAGQVIATGLGTAVITATTEDGGYTATCSVNVTTDSGILPAQATKSGLDGTTTSHATGTFNQDNTSAEIVQNAEASATRLMYLSTSTYDTTDALMRYHFKLDTTAMTGRTQFRVNTTQGDGTTTDNSEIINFYADNIDYSENSGKIGASTGSSMIYVGDMGGIIDVNAVMDSSTDMIYVFLDGVYAGCAECTRDLSGDKFNYSSIYAADTRGNGTNTFTISDYTETLYTKTVSYVDVFESITSGDYVTVTGVALDNTEVTLTAGETTQLIETVTPATAVEKRVVWTTSNEAVATVSNGIVTAVAMGNATITATSVDSGVVAQCSVNVLTAPKVTLEAFVQDGTEYVVTGYAEGVADANLIIAIYSIDDKLLGVNVGEFAPGQIEITVGADGLDKDTAVVKAFIINLDNMKPFAGAPEYAVANIWQD